MGNRLHTSAQSASAQVACFREELGPFVVAAETTRMPMIFTDGQHADNAIVFANDAFLGLTGFTRSALMGKPLKLLLGDVTDSASISSIQAILAAGGTGTWEIPCRRADKSDFLAAVFLSPVRDKNDVVRQNFLSFVELGGHVERLLDARNEFHALYELAPGFIAITEGADHRFTFANASYTHFVGRDALVGRTVAEALPGIADQGFIDLLDQVYRTGEPFVGKGIPITLSNPATGQRETRYADFVYQAVRDANNVTTGLFCEGYDVSSERAAAQALSSLQSDMVHTSRVNAMGTMATALAHELSQPLSAIANYAAGGARLVDPADKNAARLSQALQGISEAAQRAADIIRHVRDLTRRREPTRLAFNLKEATSECVRLVRATVSPGIHIGNGIPDDMIMAADRIQIQQVIINLLRNACEAVATSDRHDVAITAKASGDMLVVSVTDSGDGVPIGAAASMFSWTASSKEGGMGMGLSISRTIIDAHRGRIWLADTGPGGSTFCFSIPAATL